MSEPMQIDPGAAWKAPDRQRLIAAYGKRFKGLRFRHETVCKGGYGNPPFEFRIRCDIEGLDRHNVISTQLESKDEFVGWETMQHMIDSLARWAREWMEKNADQRKEPP